MPHYDDEFYDLPPISRHLPHSGLGVASFILALVGGAGVITVFVVTASLGLDNQVQPEPAALAMIGGGFLCSLGVNVVGAGLGIGGCCQSDRVKVFSILGLLLNGLILLGVAMLFVVAVAIQG